MQRVTSILNKSFLSNSAQETRDLGIRLSKLLKPCDIVCLKGELGTGKTTFTQGIAKGLGIKDFVRSSSFILVNEYFIKKDFKLFHIDLYRLENNQMQGLGLEEYIFSNGICIIEWADKLKDFKMPEYLDIKFCWKSETKRKIEIRKKKI